MRIEFDPTNPTEAAAVRAMLTALTPRPTAGIVMQEAPTDDAWHNGTTYTPRSVDPVAMTEVGERIAETNRVVSVSAEASDGQSAGFYLDVPTDPNAPTQTVDSTGTPWDERIHSTPATTNKDGTWRAKRGVTADQIAAVRAEQRASKFDAEMAEGLANDEELGLGTPAPEAPTVPLVEPAVSAPAAPPAPPAPPVTTAPPAPIATGSPSFLDVMKAITAAQKDGKIDTAKVKELCAAVGAGESTMGLNGPDNGDKRVAFMALLAEETK